MWWDIEWGENREVGRHKKGVGNEMLPTPMNNRAGLILIGEQHLDQSQIGEYQVFMIHGCHVEIY
jgi:hypothetical protein